MFRTFNLSFDILATVWATFPNIGRIFAQFSGHSANKSNYEFDKLIIQLTLSPHLNSGPRAFEIPTEWKKLFKN
jgi:hypothetical protein